MGLQEFLQVARGDGEADLLLKNARLVNVFTGEIINTDVAVWDGKIVGFGDYRARENMDLKGMFLAPGLIDGHVHMESSMVSPPEYARLVVPNGTGTVVCDPHEIANVLGVPGIQYILSASEDLPLNVYVMAPSSVPATDMETSGAAIGPEEIKQLLAHDRVLGLAEMMNYPGVVQGAADVLGKLALKGGLPVDGHAPGLTGKQLYAYIGAGIRSDHEATTLKEAAEKLRAGMYLMVRYGSTAKNLKDLLPVITAQNSRRCIFVSDDLHTKDLLEQGHMNFILRRAVTFGLDPVTAIRMATLNPAEYFGLQDLGAVAPGYRADMVVLENLETFRPAYVFHRGKLVAERGKYLSDSRPDKSPAVTAMNVALPPDAFRIRANGEQVRVIEVIPGQIVTGQNVLPAKTENGEIRADSGRDILKIAVVERYRGSGRIGLGLVQGFGLKTGALASTVAHDSHNIVLVGANDDDMGLAVNKLAETGGGQIVVDRGEVKAILPLPIAGLMSELPAPEVAARVRELHDAVLKLGCKLQAPFMAMAFLALPVIPELKITDMGLVDVKKFKIVDLFV